MVMGGEDDYRRQKDGSNFDGRRMKMFLMAE